MTDQYSDLLHNKLVLYCSTLLEGNNRARQTDKMDDKGHSQNMIGDQDIIWLPDRYTLKEIVDNTKLPALVKVENGYMLTEEDCLASDTILTIHGERKLVRVLASDQTGRELHIPLDCKYKLRIKPYNEVQVYNTIKDVCEAPYLPDCIENRQEFQHGGITFPDGTTFDVQGVYQDENKNQTAGLSVISNASLAVRTSLPFTVQGDFVSVPLRNDRMRTYLISEITGRKFPVFVEFLPTNERNPPYSPRLGLVRLKNVYESRITYATNYLDNKRFLITFSSDLQVELQVGRVMVEEDDDTYSTIAEPKEDPVDPELLECLINSDPYSKDYNTAVYSELEKFAHLGVSKTKDSKEEIAIAKPPVPNRAGRKNRQGSVHVQSAQNKDHDENEARTAKNGEYETCGENHPQQIIDTATAGIRQKHNKGRYEDLCIENNKVIYSYKTLQKPIQGTANQGVYKAIEEKAHPDLIANRGNSYAPEPGAQKILPGLLPTQANHSQTQEQEITVAIGKLEKKNVSNSRISGNLIKALSLPLDVAAKLQYTSEENAGYATVYSRPALPLPLPRPVITPPPVPPRGGRRNSAKKPQVDQAKMNSEPLPTYSNTLGSVRQGKPKLENKGGQKLELQGEQKWKPQEVPLVDHKIVEENPKEEIQGEVLDEILGKDEKGICRILNLLQMSEFAKGLQDHQINGELLKEIEERDLVDDLGMTLFQARKLLLYIRGWRTDDEAATRVTAEAQGMEHWTTGYVNEHLQLIKLSSFAKFCWENQVNGSLLRKIVDENMLQSIRESYEVKMTRIEEKKLRNFVINGWRPTSMKDVK